MSTVREVIYDVKERLKLTTDDVDITTEYIHHLLNLERSRFIKQKFIDYRKTVPDSILQGIELSMELTDSVPGITTGDRVLRSKTTVPQFINLEGRADFIKVLTRDFTSVPFSYVTFDRFPYTGEDKWNRNQVYCSIGPDNKLYMKSGTGYGNTILLVVVYSIFEDPEDAWFKSINYSNSINYLDTEYPLSGELLTVAISEVVRKVALSMDTPEDRDNDATESRG